MGSERQQLLHDFSVLVTVNCRCAQKALLMAQSYRTTVLAPRTERSEKSQERVKDVGKG